jgi:hypothetical protein
VNLTKQINQTISNYSPRLGLFKFLLLINIFLFIITNTIVTQALTFVENSNATFNGTKINTVWNNAQSALRFSGNNTSGTYTSLVKDATANATWNSINYEPRSPYGKELPANQTTETAYDFDEVSMVNNTAYWRFNEPSGTTIADSSGNGNTATCTGTTCPTSTTTSKFNLARDFDGVDDFYSTSLANSVKNQSIVSFSAWIRPENVTGIRTIYQESIPDNSLSRFAIEIANGGLRFKIRDNDDPSIDLNIFLTSGNFVINTWYHIVVVYNATTDIHRFYLNGNLVQTASIPLTSFENVNPGSAPKIGRHSTLLAEIFDGQIEETALFLGRELSAATVFDMYLRGATSLKLQVRSCNDPACSGENFVGPGGSTTTFFSDVINTSNALPNFSLTASEAPNNRYFQFQFTFTRDTNNSNLQIRLKNVTIDYTIASPPPTPTLSFNIRNSTDTANTNSCPLGTASITSVSSCSYRLKVNTNSTSGYNIFSTTSGNFSNGLNSISNASAGSGGFGGNLIDNSTAGTERYGVLINTGTITGTGTISRTTAFNAGTSNSVNYTHTSNQNIISATGANSPSATDTTNTSLITHNLNISPTTLPGRYSQTITYTVTSGF